VSLFTLVAVVVLAALGPGAQSAAVDDLAWLAGEWQRQTRGGTAVERWMVTPAGLVGEAFLERDGETVRTESLLIVEMDGELFYIAKPRENTYPVAFRLVSRDAGTFVFENTTHDFPQRIMYRRDADSAMTAVIEGPGEGGENQRVEFHFERR
jgi:hypothetical protein